MADRLQGYKDKLAWLRKECARMGWDCQWLDQIDNRLSWSIDQLRIYREAIVPLINEEVCVTVCGSFGRLEATAQSDIDLLMIVNKKHSAISSEDSNRYCQMFENVVRRIHELNTNAFSEKNIAVYDDPSFVQEYQIKHLHSDMFRRWLPLDIAFGNSFDEQNSVQQQIRRVSLLLESESITNNTFSKNFSGIMLQEWLDIPATRGEHWRCPHNTWNLLIREILRFLHSSHLLHFHKVKNQGKSPHLRYQKLRVTRKMLGLAAFLLLFESRTQSELFSFISAPPIIKLIALLDYELPRCGQERPPSLGLITGYSQSIDNLENQRSLEQGDSDSNVPEQMDALYERGWTDNEIHGHLQSFFDFRSKRRGEQTKDMLSVLF